MAGQSAGVVAPVAPSFFHIRVSEGLYVGLARGAVWQSGGRAQSP